MIVYVLIFKYIEDYCILIFSLFDYELVFNKSIYYIIVINVKYL